MKGYSSKEFVSLLIANGWYKDRVARGTHITYKKQGVDYIVTYSDKGNGRELSRPMTTRIIKEAKLDLSLI